MGGRVCLSVYVYICIYASIRSARGIGRQIHHIMARTPDRLLALVQHQVDELVEALQDAAHCLLVLVGRSWAWMDDRQ